jgi:hypothetical protein
MKYQIQCESRTMLSQQGIELFTFDESVKWEERPNRKPQPNNNKTRGDSFTLIHFIPARIIFCCFV